MLSPRRIGVVAAVVAVGLIAAGVFVVAEDEQSPTPVPQQPAPRGLDDEGDLRLIRQTPTRIVLGWTPELTGYGYLFSGDDTVVARTIDPARSTATFRNIYTSYEVAAIDKGDTGTYSPLAGTLTMTVTAETANTITFGWTPQAEYGYLFSGDGDVISRTYDPDRSYAKFNKSYTDYEVAVLVKGVTGTYPPAAPPAGTANLWVKVPGGTQNCTWQSTPIDYDTANSNNWTCSSLDAAYSASGLACGNTILVKGGTYATQQIYEEAGLSGCGSNVIIQAAASETPTMDYLYFGTFNGSGGTNTDAPDHITVRGLTIPEGWGSDGDTTNVVVDDIEGGAFTISGGSNITVSNGDYGPCASTDAGTGVCNIAPSAQIVIENQSQTSGITLEGNAIHDFSIHGDDHFECIRMDGVTNLTVRGNRFWNCQLYAMTSTGETGTTLIENNWFQSACEGGFSPDCDDSTVAGAIVNPGDTSGTVIYRFNSFGQDQQIEDLGSPDGGSTNRFAIGNVFGDASDCLTSRITYNYNVFFGTGGATCGSNATYLGVTAPYVNDDWFVDGNYHLDAATDADNYVPTSVPNSGAAQDYDGQNRPIDDDRDAGADER